MDNFSKGKILNWKKFPNGQKLSKAAQSVFQVMEKFSKTKTYGLEIFSKLVK